MIRILYIILICSFFINKTAYPQGTKNEKGKMLVSLGMGIDYGSTPSFTDYLKNELSYGSGDTLKTFSTGVEFFGGFEYNFTRTLSARLDYSYYLRSNHYTFVYYVFDYTIRTHQPFVMLFYNSRNNKFNFKLGAGAGYQFHILENNITATNSITYTAGGLGFRGEIIFVPKFSEKLETYIGAFVFGSTSSSLKDENGNVLKSSAGKEVNMGSYGVGARLGLSIYLN